MSDIKDSEKAAIEIVQNKDDAIRVVGIGASAGGLDAIQELFDSVPQNTGLCFVIVQHLSPDFKSLMPELLSKHTKLPIHTAVEGMKLQANCIYLNDRNTNLEVHEGKIRLTEKAPLGKLNLPIDVFFENLGKKFGEHAIGVILSGTGSDGSRGIKYIQEAGGVIMVQEPSSAQFDGMPKAAIATNLCDYILPPNKIAELIGKLSLTAVSFRKSLLPHDMEADSYSTILHLIFTFCGVDFTKYKQNTLLRRLEKRIHFHNLLTLAEYAKFLKNNEEELDIINQDFLINVTSFFRDYEAFQSYANTIIPSILSERINSKLVRVWVPGCSTGEEAYTLAIILDHYIRQNKLEEIDFRIFATDIDNRALSYAGMAVYPANASNEIPRDYLEEYFVKTGDSLRVISRIREKIVFSYHNLISDPPFIRTDLISCRNLLIYLGNDAQKKVQQNFLFSLNQSGFLFLGPSESLLIEDGHYAAINVKWRIFQKTSKTKPNALEDLSEPRLQLSSRLAASSRKSFNAGFDREQVFHKFISQHFGPSGIFVDEYFNILFIKGDAGRKLILPEGVFQTNLLNIVDQDVALLIRNGCRKVFSGEESAVRFESILVRREDQDFHFDLTFRIVLGVKELQKVIFIEYSDETIVEDVVSTTTLDSDDLTVKKIEALKYELKMTQEDLRNAVEELETSNEELQSANEELMASNEELQSTNEELQSVNEELYTVNTELEEKVEEMLKLNNDISNLFNSTDIATLFLDQDLCIRKFTPSLKKHFRLQDSDRGRPINSFASNFNNATSALIMASVRSSLSDLTQKEIELMDLEGNSFYFRCSPFITVDRHIDGVVLTFVDINELKESQRKGQLTEKRYMELFNNMGEPFFQGALLETGKKTKADWIYLEMNPAFEKLIGTTKDLVNSKKHSEVKSLIGIPLHNWFENFVEAALEDKKISLEIHIKEIQRFFKIHIFRPNQNEFAVFFNDITEEKELVIALEEEKLLSDKITENTPGGIYIYDLEAGTNIFSNSQYSLLLGYTIAEINHLSQAEFAALFHDEDREKVFNHMGIVASGKTDRIDYRFRHKDGDWVWCRSIDSPFSFDSKGKCTSFIGIFWDITEEKNAADRIHSLDLVYRETLNNSVDAILQLDQEGKIIFHNNAFKELVSKGEDIQGEYLTDHLPPAASTIIKQRISEFKNSKSKEIKRVEFQTPSNVGNATTWIDGRMIATVTENQSAVIILSLRNITDRKSFEQQLMEAKEVAEQASLHKNYFLANMSHEIRTPMNAILGFTEIMKHETLKESESDYYLDIISANSKQLLTVIDDVIDVAKLDTSKITLKFEDSDLIDLLQKLKASFKQIRKQLHKERVDFVLDLPADKESFIARIDVSRLQQILLNLVNNAFKFSTKGSIILGFEVQGDTLKFWVKDEGIGIAKEKQELIFEIFKQVDYGQKDNHGGTGLGLAISKGLVELMGGKLWVDSEINIGSTFSFTLPFEKPNAENIKKDNSSCIDNLKALATGQEILIAEDNPINQLLLKRLLQSFNFKITTAENGKEATELYPTKQFDLVLMDIRMPIMDGLEATEAILKENSEAYIIAQSAFAMNEQKSEAMQVGFKDYLTKPIKREELFRVLCEALAP